MLDIFSLCVLILGILIVITGYKQEKKPKVLLGVIVTCLSLVYVIPVFCGDFIQAVVNASNK